MISKGKTHCYGDHINTDVIIPARYLNDSDPVFLAEHCFEDLDRQFVENVQSGDIVIGGRNFGCGSSREHAPIAIKASGVSCVIAESFAKIFFRNAINIGLPVLEIEGISENIKSGDLLSVDLDKGIIKNETNGKSWQTAPFAPFMQQLIDAGGLIPYTKAKLQAQEK